MEGKPRILFIDDEPHILESFARNLRCHYDVATVPGGQEALDRIASNGSFAVVVCDMKMPQMDGIETLSRIKQLAPDTVRMMLTGNADQETAVNAVNRGEIFRFMNKPCPQERVIEAIQAGIRQYELITAEKELLEKTLTGSIQALIDVLSLTNPLAFSQARRIRDHAVALARARGFENCWRVEVASMLSQIGYVTVPQDTLARFFKGEMLSSSEELMVANRNRATEQILNHLPRLENVLSILQNNLPEEEKELFEIIQLTESHQLLVSRGNAPVQAIDYLASRNEFSSTLVAEFRKIRTAQQPKSKRVIQVDQLKVGMIVAEEIVNENGLLLIPKDYEITGPARQRLVNFKLRGAIEDEVVIYSPEDEASAGPIPPDSH